MQSYRGQNYTVTADEICSGIADKVALSHRGQRTKLHCYFGQSCIVTADKVLYIYIIMMPDSYEPGALTKAYRYAHTHTHTRTHARTHSRTHTHTHTHARTHARTHALGIHAFDS